MKWSGLGLLACLAAHPLHAQEKPPIDPSSLVAATEAPANVSSMGVPTTNMPSADVSSAKAPPEKAAPANTRSGREIYQRFREGLADPTCPAGTSPRWREHFANAPKQMAAKSDDVLPLFGYVVDALREAHLPTEFALIPFVESGYKPGARSASGPAGLWQFIGVTARNHQIPIRAGYDGRMSPVDSTKAAVRYLKTLNGIFAGDWRLAVMGYNAGEYRVLQSLRRSGQNARNAQPEKLVGLSGITQAYVQKLRALSCLIVQAEDRDGWMRAIDRPVPVLTAEVLPPKVTHLDAWAAHQGVDAAQLKRLNPAFAGGRVQRVDRALRVLMSMPAARGVAASANAVAAVNNGPDPAADRVAAILSPPDGRLTPATIDVAAANATSPTEKLRTHTVRRGESASIIASRYKLRTAELLQRNGLTAQSTLKPGMTLKLDGP
ncbi:MAG: transglycosylase SLT domain-containing protein [Pseudomonadota bacterium]|nr:transglycosylase SLT domain-containing protein [Pseudomonadota bacterium]